MSTKRKMTPAAQETSSISGFPIVFAQGVGAVNFGPQVCKIHFVDNPSPDDVTVTVTEVVLPTSSFLDFIGRSVKMLQEDGVVEKMEEMQKRDMFILKKFREPIEQKKP